MSTVKKENNVIPDTGHRAPDFKGYDQSGKIIRLKELKGKKVVLFFYPKDLTPTCTVEACNLRDNYSALTKAGIIVLGISADDEASHQKFAGRHQLPYPLIADTKHTIIDKYGVWGEKQLYGKKFMGILRTTFLIGEDGKILHVFRKVKSAEHAEQILGWIKEHR